MKIEISGLHPGLTLDVQGTQEVWHDDATGLTLTGESDPTKNPNRGWVVTAGYPKAIKASLTPALLTEAQFLPKILKALPGTPATWAIDKNAVTNTTGGARRHYVDPCLAAYLATLDRKWLLADVNWNLMQGNRPSSHVPFVVSGDGYSKPYVNASNPAIKFSHEWQNPAGWNFFDSQHNDYARMFGLACLRHPLGTINCAQVWRWTLQSADPRVPCTNWLTSDRGIGWKLNWGLVAALLDLGETDKAKDFRDQFCAGIKPRDALKTWCLQALDDPSLPVNKTYAGNGCRAATRANGQGAPVIQWEPQGSELNVQQTYMVGIMLWGVARLVVTNILPSLTERLRTWGQQVARDVIARSFDPVRGWAWSYGLTTFATRAEAQALLDAAETQGVSGWEICNGPHGYNLRSAPVWGSEVPNLMVPGLAMLLGSQDPSVQAFLARPEYGQFPQYDLATEALT